jgi:hypothetical protein
VVAQKRLNKSPDGRFYITRNRNNEKLRIPGTEEILTFKTREDALKYLEAADLLAARFTVSEETPPSEPKTAHQWRLILIAAVSGAGAAITAVLGVSRLYWWSLAVVVFAVGAALWAVMYAITEEKHRTLALWISTGLCAALLTGIGIYNLIGPSPMRTSNVVANDVVALSSEAGVSATKEPSALNVDGQAEVFEPGSAETATCYAMVGSSVWLYFYFGSGDNGWAPFSDFHYENGFPDELPSRC